MDDIDRVLEIARRYGVRAFLNGDEFFREYSWPDGELRWQGPDAPRRGLKDRELTRGASPGPRSHWADVEKRMVWFDHFDVREAETFLHEICHCIVCPPGGIDVLSEDVALMPFERVLARQCLSAESVRKVVAWQEGTQLEWWNPEKGNYYGALGEVPNYTRHPKWRASLKGLRAMGALSPDGRRVTWRLPDWKKAPRALMARGHYDA